MLRGKELFLVLLVLVMLGGCAEKPPLRVLWPPPPNTPKLEFVGVYASEQDFRKDGTAKLLAMATGSAPEFLFKSPLGIASDGEGKVFISDLHERNVRVFDFNTKKIELFSKKPVFQRAMGIDIDKNGRIYVADGEAQQVLVFSSDWNPLFTIGNKDLFENPAYLKVNDGLGRLYVADGRGNRIVVFDLKGKFLFEFGKGGNGDGEFFAPQGLAFSPQNELFIADMYNARIQVFDPDGKYLRKFGERGDQPWQFISPKDVAFDSEGNLYIVDARRSAMLTYSSRGDLLLVTGTDTPSLHPLGFAQPSSVFIDKNDRIYIADTINRRFTIWQYLSAPYLAKHPVTAADEALIAEKIKEQKPQ